MLTISSLSNRDISKIFVKYLKLRYKPVGMYYSGELPLGRLRYQHRFLYRCIVKHAFNASRYGGSSILQAERGCIGGQWWSGFSKKAPKGLAFFLTKGREGFFGGRGERFKKDARTVRGVFKEPGPVKQPEGTKYIIYQQLRKIPDNVKVEFVLFFANPKEISELVTLCNYARHKSELVRAPGGSGCMSVMNFPLQLEQEPEPDAVLGFWDLFARRFMPKNILTLAIRPWFAEDLAKDIPESFLAYQAPYTFKYELKRFLTRRKKK
ncbi:MAG: hypothetical protein FK732_08270 [Asgard group archaeon]|nr:hypothetical protein [Asgard group archaeon]